MNLSLCLQPISARSLRLIPHIIAVFAHIPIAFPASVGEGVLGYSLSANVTLVAVCGDPELGQGVVSWTI